MGETVPAGQDTVAAWLESWLATVKPTLRPRTWMRYGDLGQTSAPAELLHGALIKPPTLREPHRPSSRSCVVGFVTEPVQQIYASPPELGRRDILTYDPRPCSWTWRSLREDPTRGHSAAIHKERSWK